MISLTFVRLAELPDASNARHSQPGHRAAPPGQLGHAAIQELVGGVDAESDEEDTLKVIEAPPADARNAIGAPGRGSCAWRRLPDPIDRLPTSDKANA
jgi:hypothetical protein